MMLSEKLYVYETVITALKNRMNMPELLGSFPIDQQLEAIRFMEFMESDPPSPASNDINLQ